MGINSIKGELKMTFIDWILGFGALCVVATLLVVLFATLWFIYSLIDDVKTKATTSFNKDSDEWK